MKLKTIFLVILFIFCGSVFADSLENLYQTETVKDDIFKLMNTSHVPGVAVDLVVRGVPHIYYFGYANPALRQPVNGSSLFEIGSVTKLFTSLLLAEDVKADRISLNQSVGKYLPDFVAANSAVRNVTLEQFATHTSGFPFDVPANVKTREGMARYLRWWRLPRRSGSTWIYSNVGMGVLGDCLEEIHNASYDQLYRNNILGPLGMEPIGITVPDQFLNHYAEGYRADGSPANHVNLPAREAAGSMKASPEDMMKFLREAIGMPGTPPFIVSAMHLTQTPFVRVSSFYQGLGWQIYPLDQREMNVLLHPAAFMHVGPIPAKQLFFLSRHFDGNNFFDKTGTTAGFRAYIAVLPNQQSGIVILTNRRISDAPLLKTARDILFKSVGFI